MSMSGIETLQRPLDDIHMRPLDWVDAGKLPSVEHIAPTNNPELVFERIVPYKSFVRNRPVSSESIDKIKPSDDVTTMNDVGIDYELLHGDARRQEARMFRAIIRMGGAYKHLTSSMNPFQLEALAVETTGKHASLVTHGTEQARRMDAGMTQQQVLHQRVFADLRAYFGDSRVTRDAYALFSSLVPNFSPLDVKRGVNCGFGHDYGEAWLGIDVPFELKVDPAYTALEAGAGVDFMNLLHFPATLTARQKAALIRRYTQQEVNIGFEDEDHDLIKHLLGPSEINEAIFGTEWLHHGPVVRGNFFSGIERGEYVQSGEIGFEAVEHNFQGIRGDQVLSQNILRLGVSTFFNSLGALIEHAEKYISLYDFLRQNSERIEYYFNAVSEDIRSRDIGRVASSNGIFGIDPFTNYSETSRSDTITRRQAKERFLETKIVWEDWKKSDSLMRRLWEAYYGTTDPLTNNSPDTTFLNKTAREVDSTPGTKIVVIKGLVDIFGVGLDSESQRAQEEKVSSLIAA